MEYAIEDFAQKNFYQFSQQETKTNNFLFFGIALAVLGGVAYYHYYQNNKRKSVLTKKMAEISHLEVELAKLKTKSDNNPVP